MADSIIGGLRLGLVTPAFARLTPSRQPRAKVAAKQQQVRAFIENLATPTLRLAPAASPAFSKLGGEPEMPPELAWPSGPGGPLAFVAQLDLAEARAAGGPAWLPPAGALFFFFDDQLDVIDGRLGEMTVLFTPTPGVQTRQAPPALRPEWRFRERRVAFTPGVSRPTIWWLGLHAFLLPMVEDLYETCEPDHRVGGYPAELRAECLPARCETGRRGFAPGQTDWRLLLQLDADGELGRGAIDDGRIYVLIREADARRGDFSNTVCVVHFHHAAGADAPFDHDCGIMWA